MHGVARLTAVFARSVSQFMYPSFLYSLTLCILCGVKGKCKVEGVWKERVKPNFNVLAELVYQTILSVAMMTLE
jgi:hypothetical protein